MIIAVTGPLTTSNVIRKHPSLVHFDDNVWEGHIEYMYKTTGKIIGYKWHRTGDNELFDGLVYNYCAIEFIAQVYYNDYAKKYTDLPEFDLAYFWQTLFPVIEQQTFNND